MSGENGSRQATACEKSGLHGNPPQALVFCDECKVAAQHLNENSLKVTCSLPDILEESWHEPAQPILHPVWRGSFRISTEEFGIVNGLAAYLSSQASPRVAEAAISFPRSLHLRKCSRLEVFPRLLSKHGVQDRDIGLYFFPEKERDEQTYEKLVEDLISQDLAVKAELENVELLLFTSPQLPVECWSKLRAIITCFIVSCSPKRNVVKD